MNVLLKPTVHKIGHFNIAVGERHRFAGFPTKTSNM